MEKIKKIKKLYIGRLLPTVNHLYGTRTGHSNKTSEVRERQERIRLLELKKSQAERYV